MAFLDPILNPLVQPLLNYNPFWAVFVLALVISVIVTIAYKLFTNQDEMKRLKERQKEFSKRMKSLRDRPDEMMKVQKEAMKVNMEYMKHSFKVMLITMLPILLIFGWMNVNLGYEPIMPGEEFVVSAMFAKGVTGEALLEVDADSEVVGEVAKEISSEVAWRVKSKSGTHTLNVKVGDDMVSKDVLVSKSWGYIEPVKNYKDSKIETVMVEHNELRPFNYLVSGEISLFGWQPGWLGVYIILSIIFSIGLRKVFKVY